MFLILSVPEELHCSVGWYLAFIVPLMIRRPRICWGRTSVVTADGRAVGSIAHMYQTDVLMPSEIIRWV
ncbi:hypothetical protein DPMN_170003 [Dreissena polymorpha]|uniref:Uncharacterized protein n=1 Tax=Dreissena polymorpha TaxID=45954 RepID=A0A9D4IB57_DREPO|nr:hypothetical protein DPMN_170003 [Dreissena polymorpha]